MRITEIRDETVPIQSEISNAFISFAEMTVSAVAVMTDVVRNGKPVCGYGFNSNGRYWQSGILRERIIPRLMKADSVELLNDEGSNVDPFKAWNVMMRNEKPGGHGDRAVAVGTMDMAIWDLAAKIEDKPLACLLADRFNGGLIDSEVNVYAAGGYYYPGKGLSVLQDEMQGYLDAGYDTVKMKIGGAPLEQDIERIEAVLKIAGKGEALAVDANGRCDLDTALEYSDALAPYKLKWYEEPGDPLDFELNSEVAKASPTPNCDGRKPLLDAGCPQSHSLRWNGSRARLPAIRPVAELWTCRVPTNRRDDQGERLVAAALYPSRWPPVRLAYRGWAGFGRQRILSRRIRAIRRIRRWRPHPGRESTYPGYARNRH